jgi:hypothetical protein
MEIMDYRFLIPWDFVDLIIYFKGKGRNIKSERDLVMCRYLI